MLQRILGTHSKIHTVSEPWIMLHPFYVTRQIGYEAEFDASLAHRAVTGFIQSLPNGIDDYYEGVRRMYTFLYEKKLKSEGKSYFLDKTPRYYNIIPDLHRTFPQAKFIILYRNPLACLSSILNTWVKENLFFLYYYKRDLLNAPILLVEGVKQIKRDVLVIRYEDIVAEPDNKIKRICEYLNIEYEPEMINYGQTGQVNWVFGDKITVNKNTKPVKNSVNKWMSLDKDTQTWRLYHDYLRMLGESIINELGYSYHEMLQQLEKEHPSRQLVLFTHSLTELINKDYIKRNFIEKCILKAFIKFSKRLMRK